MATAHSSCETFKELFDHLGLHMKPSKEQRPAHQQKMLGVQVSIGHDHVQLSACETRKSKAIGMIQSALSHNSMSAAEAQRCAGKLAFLATTFFGCVGRAALQPLYSRGHGIGKASHDQLTSGLRHSLHLLHHMLEHTTPRLVPLGSTSGPMAVIYTDACFRPGESKSGPSSNMENGWGYVIKIGNLAMRSSMTTGKCLLILSCDSHLAKHSFTCLKSWQC